MTETPASAMRSAAIIDTASLLVALRDARGLGIPIEFETDAQAEAVATLWRLATGGGGVVRNRAATALWRLGEL